MLLGRVASGLALGAVIFAVSPALSTACITKTANVDDLYMALDADGNRKRSEFYTDTQQIHCVAEVANHRPDTTVTLRLRSVQLYDLESQKFFDSVRMLGQLDVNPTASEGIQKIDGQLKKTHAGASGADGGANADEDATPFDAGRFVCEVWLDKDPATDAPDLSATFNVLIATCPPTTIVSGTKCYGFYDHDEKCPEYGVGTSEPAQCTCDKVMGWACPQ
ncbi:MAG TPA: hypothetical protein VIF62_01310 [Labilithrix sp.]|jgi:hypothetical protein